MYHRSRPTRLRRPPSSSSSPLLTMPPSSIHHINSDTVDIISPVLDRSIIEVSKNALRAGDLLKVQAVQNDDGLWFALNSAQLDLCRRLEDEGSCKVVLVDPVPAAEVPRDVRRMMKLPPVAATGSGEPKNGNKEPEVDNNFAADVPEVQAGPTKGGGKGYRMLDQADPLDATSLQSTDGGGGGGGGGGHASTDDDVTRVRGLNDLEADDKVIDTEDDDDDDSSSDSSTDSECDWSEEADDAGSEDEQGRMADTSDEMSCLL